ncbi:Heterokaryon incompatibility [Fusarium oxysporum f. sp. vasinfectum]|nr:Heterokaryon incompatibility [Fusarium oxysporum f. sp. vasinfectum]
MSPHERTWNRIRPLPDICAHQLSDESLSFVRSCLQTCLNKHTLCWQSDGGLPARLLDVGRCGDSAIRLVETESAASVKYIALSYCWGDNVTVKTTLAGLENMKSGISISELLQAYVDAVALTRELGIQYLWIDALCIIQDSHEDWVKESAKMSGIYAKAYLTIAAASSGSANQPFLRHSLPTGSHQDKYYTRVFSKQVVDGEGSHLLKARVIPESGVHSKWQDCFDECFPREPWSQRGWTLQEQLLSTRLLSFSLTEMQWTCQEAVLCECRSKLNHRRLFGQKPVSQITRAFDAFRFWHKVVENYSNRLLTNPQDKLTAISGIAAILQQKTQSRYAAGLWADNIDMDLLWRRATPTTKLSRSGFVAPSFSWASIDGEVDYCCFRNGKRSYRKSASVVAVETNTSREAPLGRVESGRLIIHGPLIAGFMEDSSHNGVFVVKLGRIRLDLVADAPLQQTIARGPEGNLERTNLRAWKGQGGLINYLLPLRAQVPPVPELDAGLSSWVVFHPH